MKQPLVYKSPPIPSEVYEDEEFMLSFTTHLRQLHEADSPSPGDQRRIFEVYEEATPRERQAIDYAFTWLTGYTLATLAAQVQVSRGIRSRDRNPVEGLLTKWRKKCRRSVKSS